MRRIRHVALFRTELDAEPFSESERAIDTHVQVDETRTTDLAITEHINDLHATSLYFQASTTRG